MKPQTSRQINITASPELVATLEKTCPVGMPLSTYAREVLERLLKPEQLPLLAPRERGPQPVDMTPMLEALEGFEQRVWEAQRETLRAVHEHGSWVRLRANGAKPGMEMNQKALNAGEQAVREWERSVGR